MNVLFTCLGGLSRQLDSITPDSSIFPDRLDYFSLLFANRANNEC
jgi:hypothetical protein